MLTRITSQIPLIGNIAFGLIDRGTNIIQVRPITACPLNCVFCSVDAGVKSKNRQSDFYVDVNHLINSFKELAEFKGINDLEAHIDGVGDSLTYPDLPELISGLSDNALTVSLQTHGTLLTKNLISKLERKGLNRINLSIDALNPELAKALTSTKSYDLNKVMDSAEIISRTSIELMISPLWIPGLNDNEIPRIIEFAKSINARLGVQKWLWYKHGRNPKGIKQMGWSAFNKQLDKWEKDFKIKLRLSKEDFNIHKAKTLPKTMRVGEKLRVKTIIPGWLKGEMISTAKGRNLTILNAKNIPINKSINIKIINNKHNIYIAKKF